MSTPAPCSYNQSDHGIKPARFTKIHLGTDVKVTAKEVELTPGPGHYVRTEGTMARTFHHAAKN